MLVSSAPDPDAQDAKIPEADLPRYEYQANGSLKYSL